VISNTASFIKDHTKIIRTEISNSSTTYTLENDSFLSEIFESLPCGIIDKSETRLGATTLELKTSRNSTQLLNAITDAVVKKQRQQ
jgi:hypothetical protein